MPGEGREAEFVKAGRSQSCSSGQPDRVRLAVQGAEPSSGCWCLWSSVSSRWGLKKRAGLVCCVLSEPSAACGGVAGPQSLGRGPFVQRLPNL